MLPGPNELSQKDSSDAETSQTSSSRQHGLLHEAESSPLQSPGGNAERLSGEPFGRAVSHKSLEGLESPLRRLSRTNSHSGSRSPVDRISEHENASKRASKRSGKKGPSFTVVHRSAKSASGVQLTDFPNEVLTHVLSHLPPATLSSIALVSKQFHQLVTTPHAWRSAFSRYFPGPESLTTPDTDSQGSHSDIVGSDRRLFTRLCTLSSWRNEYILRCRLLRSLGRGKPAENMKPATANASRGNAGQAAQITFNSGLACPVTHIHTSFGSENRNGHIKFIHGADELGMASISDSKSGKLEKWGFQDSANFGQFQDIAPGEAQYGLGSGETVGVPNSMDISQTYGMVYGEGFEHESTLWFRHTEERRGRALFRSSGLRELDKGIPQLPEAESICSVWIAKSRNLPDLSRGAIAILSGSSTGIVTAYSCGTNTGIGHRLERGQMTFRWVVSPGVPIVSIVLDEDFSQQRMGYSRIWAVVLNALGEVYYMTDFPTRLEDKSPPLSPVTRVRTAQEFEREAWVAGQSVRWKLVEPTRRTAHIDPFEKYEVDGSYSPQLSSPDMHLSRDQVVAETLEVESFLRKKPKHFRKVCYGWDMCRRLELDFAASDKFMAGELVLVLGISTDKNSGPDVKRYARHKIDDRTPKFANERSYSPVNEDQNVVIGHADSVFGGSRASTSSSWSFAHLDEAARDADAQDDGSARVLVEEWRTSNLTFAGPRFTKITAAAVDHSWVANLCSFEDPLTSVVMSSNASSPMSSPVPRSLQDVPRDIPGQRARLIALGTDNGAIYLYNMRSAGPVNSMLERIIDPVRIIRTDSPQISCLGLTALYLVHGGNDGLVQAWDPLASTLEPIRTLNSRFSSRARRRLVQAAASPAGIGINLFAASAIMLDPDATQLRGVVSLGSHLRYWSFSSDGADSFKGNKRKLRRSERGSNQGTDRFSNTGRGALRDYIANEKLDLEREKRDKRKENERLVGRFGIDLLGPGASEDEIMAYATMLSEEAAKDDERRRSESSGSEGPSTSVMPSPRIEESDAISEVLERSLQEMSMDLDSPEYSLRTRGKRQRAVLEDGFATSSSASSFAQSSVEDEQDEDNDLQYALNLSRAEQESRTTR